MFAYPRLQDLAYPDRVLSDEGALSRSDPPANRAKAGRTGASRNGGRPGGNGGALGGVAPSLGRARCLAVRGGSVNPASRVPVGALAPPTAPSPRLGSRGTGKPRTHCAARMRKCGCLKFESEV